MPRYIDADAICENLIAFSEKYNYSNTAISYAIGYALGVIDDAPTADVVEVKHGKWLKQNPLVDTEECSLCKYNIYSEELETPFCPWCGARMDDGEDTMSDYDPCDECHGNGDDYYQDEDGDWMIRCHDCPLWERREDEN